MLIFQVQLSNMPCILLEHVDMGAHYKLKIYFADIGNLFLEQITYRGNKNPKNILYSYMATVYGMLT